MKKVLTILCGLLFVAAPVLAAEGSKNIAIDAQCASTSTRNVLQCLVTVETVEPCTVMLVQDPAKQTLYTYNDPATIRETLLSPRLSSGKYRTQKVAMARAGAKFGVAVFTKHKSDFFMIEATR